VKSASSQRLWRHAVKENPRAVLCGSPRAQSAFLVARQLPTDHDHDGGCSHSIHEYQSDQPSHIAATAPACLRLSPQSSIPIDQPLLDRSFHIRTPRGSSVPTGPFRLKEPFDCLPRVPSGIRSPRLTIACSRYVQTIVHAVDERGLVSGLAR